ncbi:MAG: GNAT family N-acetyltransferase, partial [Candidatus Omnitrophica bacterium]|nr:GNAT family N-acetyltransferase [Candidatus Omnitrophota bacterium]
TRVEDGDKFAPTEPFLRLTGQWPWKTDLEEKLYPHKLMRVSGLRDFSNLDAMFRGVMQKYGFRVDPYGRCASVIENPQSIPASVYAKVPLQVNGAFVNDANDNPVSVTTRVNPYTREIIGPSLPLVVMRNLMYEGKLGEVTAHIINNGRSFRVSTDELATENMPKGTKYEFHYEYKALDGKIYDKKIEITLSEDAKIVYLEGAAFKFNKRAFAFVERMDINVPYAIVWTFRNNAPSTDFLTFEQFKALRDGGWISSGERVEVNFGSGYETITLRENVHKVWHPKYLAKGMTPEGKEYFAPAVIEYSRHIKYPEGLEEKDTFILKENEDGSTDALDVSPIGGVIPKESTVKDISKLVPEEHPVAAAVETPAVYSELEEYFRAIHGLGRNVKEFRNQKEYFDWMNNIYQQLPRLQEKVRIDLDNKMYMEYLIKQSDVWRQERIDWLNRNIADREENLVKANERYQAALVKADSDIAALRDQVTAEQAELASLQDNMNYWLNHDPVNEGLVSYYNEQIVSKEHEINQLNQQVQQAIIYKSRILSKDQSIDVVLDVVDAENSIKIWQDRASIIPQSADWYKNPEEANKKWTEAQLAAAREQLTDAEESLRYVQTKAMLAQQGISYYQNKHDQAVSGADSLTDEAATLESNNDWSINWLEQQVVDAMNSVEPDPAIKQKAIDYWTVRYIDAKVHYEQLTGSAWDGAHHDPTTDSLIGTAQSYVQTTETDLNNAEDYSNTLQNVVDPDDNIASLPEVQAYLDEVRAEIGDTLDKVNAYINAKAKTVNNGIKLLRRFQSARDDVLDLTSEIAESSMRIQKQREALYKEAKEIANKFAGLQQKYPHLPLFTEKEIKDLLESENPEGYLGQYMMDNFLGNSAQVTDLYRILGSKIDLYSVGVQYQGTPQTHQRGVGIRTPMGENAMNLFAIGIADRNFSKEMKPGEYKSTKERRLILFDNFAASKGNLSLAYVGYADVSLSKDNSIQVHDIHIRDDLAKGYFADLNFGASFTEAKEKAGIIAHNEDGDEIVLPHEIFVKEQLLYSSVGFGWEDKKTGKMWKVFFRPEWDTSKWANKSFYPYGGVEFKTPVSFLSSKEKGITTSVGGRTMYAGTDSLKAIGFVKVELPRDVAFTVEGGINGKYDMKTLRFGLEVPVPFFPKTSAEFDYGINWVQGGQYDGFGVKFGPLYRLGKDKDVELLGIPVDVSPQANIEGFLPQKTGPPLVTGVPEKLLIKRFEDIFGNPVIPSKAAFEEMLLLKQVPGLGYRLDKAKALIISVIDYANSRTLKSLSAAELAYEGIIYRAGEGYFVCITEVDREVKIGKDDGRTLILPHDYVVRNFGDVKYPVIVRAGEEVLELMNKFYNDNNSGIVALVVDKVNGYTELTVEGLEKLARDGQLRSRFVYDDNGAKVKDASGDYLFVYFAGDNQLMLNDAGYNALTGLGNKYIVLPKPADDGRWELEFKTEAEVAHDWAKYGFTVKIEGNTYTLITKDGLAISLPQYLLERQIAFLEGRLFVIGNKLTPVEFGAEIPAGAEKVVVFINDPDLARGTIATAWTDKELKENWRKLRVEQVKDNGKYVWYHDTDKANGRIDVGEQRTNFEYSYKDKNAETEAFLLNSWRPVLESVVVNAAGDPRTVEFNADADGILKSIYGDNLLLVKSNFATQWVANSELADSTRRRDLASEIYKGSMLMRINTDGSVSAYYYPNADNAKSRVMALINGVEGAPVHGMNLDGTVGKSILYYSTELGGIKEIKYGDNIKKFKLSKHYIIASNNEEETINYVGYDAWGRVIVEPYMVNGKIKNIRVNLDEKSDVVGEEALGLLNISIEDAKKLDVSRIYSGFEVGFDLRDQVGWAVTTGKKITFAGREYPIIAEILKDAQNVFQLNRYFAVDLTTGYESWRINLNKSYKGQKGLTSYIVRDTKDNEIGTEIYHYQELGGELSEYPLFRSYLSGQIHYKGLEHQQLAGNIVIDRVFVRRTSFIQNKDQGKILRVYAVDPDVGTEVMKISEKKVQFIYYDAITNNVVGTETFKQDAKEYKAVGETIQRSAVIAIDGKNTTSLIVNLRNNNSDWAKYTLKELIAKGNKLTVAQRDNLLRSNVYISVIKYDYLGREVEKKFGNWIEENNFEGVGQSITPLWTKLYHNSKCDSGLIWTVTYEDGMAIPGFNSLPIEIKSQIAELGIDANNLRKATVKAHPAWGVNWTDYYDDYGRKIASETVEGLVVTVQFNRDDDKTPTKGYLVTPSIVYLNQTKNHAIEAQKIIPKELLHNLKELGIDSQVQLIDVGKVAVFIKNSTWNPTGLTIDVTGKTKSPSEEASLLIPNNPLGWELVHIAPTGYKSINKWWEKTNAPFGILPGQIIYRNGDALRETRYDRKDGDWFIYKALFDKLELVKTHAVGFNYKTGVTFEERQYITGPRMKIFMKDAIPLCTESFEFDKWIRYSDYQVNLSARDSDLYYAIVENEAQHEGPIGRALLKADKWINGTHWSIVKNGKILIDHKNRFNDVTADKTEWSLHDQVNSGSFGQAKKIFSKQMKELKDGIIKEGHLYKTGEGVVPPANLESITFKEEVTSWLKSIVFWAVTPIILILVFLGLRRRSISRFLRSKNANINEMTVKDFEDFGFAHKEATAITERRKSKIGFVSFNDFVASIRGDLARSISGLNNNWLFGKARNNSRQNRAIRRLQNSLQQRSAAVIPAYRELALLDDVLNILNLQGTKEVVSNLIVKGLIDLDAVKDTLDKLAPFYGLISGEVFKAKFLSFIMTAAYFDANTLLKTNVKEMLRRKVSKMFRNLGLGIEPGKEGFCGENAWLFDSIIKSIEHAPDFEELDLPAEISPSGTYVLTSDDLEKEAVRLEANGTPVQRWRIVSLEQFVLMQFISAHMVALNGNGRFEEYIYKKISGDPKINRWHSDSTHGQNVIKLIENIYKPLLDLFWNQQGLGLNPNMPGKQEKVKDKFGIYRTHQWSLLWEEWNEAFRFLLGQSELKIDGNLYIKGKEITDRINELRNKLDNEVNRLLNGGKIDNEGLLRLIRALVFSIERATNLPRVKHRLKHYLLFWMPIWQIIINKDIRKKVFSAKKIFGDHVKDIKKKFYVGLVVVLNTGFFSALAYLAINKWEVLSVPYYMSVNPWLGLIPLSYLAVLAIFWYLRSKAIKATDAILAVKLHKLQLGLQALVLVTGLALAIMSPESSVHALPEWLRWIIKATAFGLILETFRLSFYAMHYSAKFVITTIHYKQQNIYAVVFRYQLAKALVMLFTDKTEGWYYSTSRTTMGQERIIEFRESVLRDLSDPADYQLLISQQQRTQWANLLEKIYIEKLMTFTDIKELKRFLKAGDKKAAKERMHRVIRWTNDQVRMDKPRPPVTLRGLLPYCVSMQGYKEDTYFTEKDLNTQDNSDANRVKEKTTRLGLLAKYKPAYWNALIERLIEGINFKGNTIKIDLNEAEQMKALSKNPRNILNINKVAMEYLVPWANTYLADLWNNSYSALKIKRRYDFSVRMIVPAMNVLSREQLVEDKTSRLMVKHSGSFGMVFEIAFDKLSKAERNIGAALNNLHLTARQEKLIRRLFKNADYNADLFTLREYLYYFIPVLRNACMQRIIDKAELQKEATRIISLLQPILTNMITAQPKNGDLKKVAPSLEPIMRAVIEDGLTATWNREKTIGLKRIEQVHAFKWNSLTASMAYSFGLTLDLIDADHHSRTEDIWSAPEVISEFVYNRRLGSVVPVIEHYLGEDLGILGRIVPSGENAFTFHAQMGKDLMGGLTAYGKFMVLTKAMRWSEGLSGDDYVAEDSETVVRFRGFGYECERAGYYRRGKSWMYLILAHMTSCFKWANDSGESVMGRTPIKMLLSGKVTISYIIDNFWWDGFGFYLKKPHITRYLKWLTAFYLIFNWNLFIGLPLALWLLSDGQSQAISFGTALNHAYERHKGFVLGSLIAIKDIFMRNLWYFVHWIFIYEDAVGVLGAERLAKFDSNPAKGGTLKRDLRWQDNYLRSDYAIRQGAFWTAIILAFVGFHPYVLVLWFFPMAMFIAAWIGTYIVNERITKKDILGNIGQMIYAGLWGFLDQLNFINAKLPLAGAFEKKVLDKQIGLINAVVRAVGIDLNKERAAKVLSVYSQYYSHFRRLYRTASIVLMAEVMKIVEDSDKYKKDKKAILDELKNKDFSSDKTVPVGFAYDLLMRINDAKEYIKLLSVSRIITREDYNAFDQELSNYERLLQPGYVFISKIEGLLSNVIKGLKSDKAEDKEGNKKKNVKAVEAEIAKAKKFVLFKEAIDLLSDIEKYLQSENFDEALTFAKDALKKKLGGNDFSKISYKEFEQIDWYVTEYEYLPYPVARYAGRISDFFDRIAWNVPILDAFIALWHTIRWNKLNNQALPGYDRRAGEMPIAPVNNPISTLSVSSLEATAATPVSTEAKKQDVAKPTATVTPATANTNTQAQDAAKQPVQPQAPPVDEKPAKSKEELAKETAWKWDRVIEGKHLDEWKWHTSSPERMQQHMEHQYYEALNQQAKEITYASHPVTARIMAGVRAQFEEMANLLNSGLDHPEFTSRLVLTEKFLTKIAQRLLSANEQEKIKPEVSIRVSEAEAELTSTNTVLRVGIYPVAANPLHWDHINCALVAIAELGLDKVIFDVQSGKDTRKPILNATECYRYELAKEEIALFAPLFSFSENISDCGETDIFRILKLNPKQKIDAYYIVGGDHYFRWVQLKDPNNQLLPDNQQPQDNMFRGTPEYEAWTKEHGKEPSLDTIQKLEDNPDKLGMDKLMHSISAIFILRGKNKHVTGHALKHIYELPEAGGASATAIRDTFKGMANGADVKTLKGLMYIPYMGYRYILAYPEYLDMLVNLEKYEKTPQTSIPQKEIPSDFEQIVKINQLCFERGFRDFGPDIVRDNIIKQAIRGNPEYLIGLEKENNITSGYIVYGNKDGAIYIYYMAVNPAYHGRSIGLTLVEIAIEFALKNNINYLALDVSKHNPKAIEFYNNLPIRIPVHLITKTDYGKQVCYRYSLKGPNGNKISSGSLSMILFGLLSLLPFVGGCTVIPGVVAVSMPLILVIAAIVIIPIIIIIYFKVKNASNENKDRTSERMSDEEYFRIYRQYYQDLSDLSTAFGNPRGASREEVDDYVKKQEKTTYYVNDPHSGYGMSVDAAGNPMSGQFDYQPDADNQNSSSSSDSAKNIQQPDDQSQEPQQPSGAIRLSGGWVTADEAKVRRTFIGETIKEGHVSSLFGRIEGRDTNELCILQLPDKHALFSDLAARRDEIFNIQYAAKDETTQKDIQANYSFKNESLKDDFQLVFVGNGLFDEVVFYPSWHRPHTYATWKYFHRLADLYEQLNDANRARVIQFLIE